MSSAEHLASSGLVVSNTSAASPSAGSRRSSIGVGDRRGRSRCGISCYHRQQSQHGRCWWNGFTCVCRCYQPKNTRPKWLNSFHAFTKSIVWRILYIFFSLFLLFGSPIQDLLAGPDGDIVFEVIRNIMLVYFVLDMLLRCIMDKEYFVCAVSGGGSSSATTTTGRTLPPGFNNNPHLDAREVHLPCSIGSFLFWCDLVSTLAILYDLSYANKNSNGVRQIEIGLDSDGVPVSQETM
jgi:hypothetical protein